MLFPVDAGVLKWVVLYPVGGQIRMPPLAMEMFIPLPRISLHSAEHSTWTCNDRNYWRLGLQNWVQEGGLDSLIAASVKHTPFPEQKLLSLLPPYSTLPPTPSRLPATYLRQQVQQSCCRMWGGCRLPAGALCMPLHAAEMPFVTVLRKNASSASNTSI